MNGATTTYNYSATNNAYCNWAFPTSVSEPLSMSQSYAWNCTGGVMTSVTDENSQVTSTTYSDPYFWRPASVTFPDTGQTSWTYNSQISTTTTTKMNSSQNIVSTVLLDGLGRTKQTQLSDPEGLDYQDTKHDAVGRVASVSNPYRSTSDPTYGLTSYQYDPLNRPTSVTLQDGSVASASYTNNTVTVTDPAGKTRQSTFDSLGRLTQVIEVPGGAGFETDYAYDALGNLLCVGQKGTNTGTFSGCGSIPAGWRARTFVYDAMSRLTSEANPETGTIAYRYDSDSNCASPNSSTGDLLSRTDARSIRTCYQYDALHRMTQKNYSDGVTPSLYFSYDVAPSWMPDLKNVVGRLVEAYNQFAGESGSSATALVNSYDPLGRVVRQWQQTPYSSPGGYYLYYSYDLAGDMTSYSTVACCTFTQSFDTTGRPTGLTSSLSDSQHPGVLATVDSSVGYYPHGALRKMMPGNGLTETAAFNSALQPCRINVNSSGTALGTCTDAIPSGNVQDFSYGFNAGSSDNGDVMSWTATGQQAFSRTFGYDTLNRLTTLAQSSGNATGCSSAFSLGWGYDAWGNRTDQTVTAGTCNAFHASVNANNQLSGSPYQYDAAGDMTSDGNHTYFYDAENRLIQVDGTLGTCSTATACYIYDAVGHRAQKATGSTYLDYFYDLGGKVVTEWCSPCGGRTGAASEYAYMSGNLVAEYANNTIYFAHVDHLGSTRVMTALNQSVAQSLDYLPFGELDSSDSGINNFKFTGDERDSETNLDHTWFRQYSSQLGRWMHPDPAGLAAVDITNPQSWNRYSYVFNDPMDYVDPSGLCPNDQSWSAQLCNQAVAFGGTSYFNTWNQFLALETALTPTSGGDLVQDPNVVDTCPPGGDCSLWVQTPFVYGNLGGISIWDFLKNPVSLTVLFPLFPVGPEASGGVGFTVAYNPRTDTGCAGPAVGAMVPAGGRSAAIGPLTVGNLSNADQVLGGGSMFAGGQSSPAVGVQAQGNGSGILAGATFGLPGIVVGGSDSGCKADAGKKLLQWIINNLLP